MEKLKTKEQVIDFFKKNNIQFSLEKDEFDNREGFFFNEEDFKKTGYNNILQVLDRVVIIKYAFFEYDFDDTEKTGVAY